MKTQLLCLSLLLGSLSAAQVKIGDNHQNIDESAVLELESTNLGFLPPRLTTEQRDAIIEPAEGLLIYNTDTKCLNYYSAIEWLNSCGLQQQALFDPNSFTSSPGGYLVQGIDVNDTDETEILPFETLQVNVNQIGVYNFSAVANGVTFSASGQFTQTGPQEIVLQSNGTPETFGKHVYSIGDYSFERTTYVPDRRYKDITNQGGEDGRHHRFIYYVFTSDSGRTWLLTNLGANYNKVGFESFNPETDPAHNDHNAYGSEFQWGRYSDGHELINWTAGNDGVSVNGTTDVLSEITTPDHNLFIYNPVAPQDWLSTQNNDLWQGESGANNPCPNGFRLPTNDEFNVERDQYGMTYIEAALEAPFNFVLACHRTHNNGALGTGSGGAGENAEFWTSTTNTDSSSYRSGYYFLFGLWGIANVLNNGERARGQSVRCIKN